MNTIKTLIESFKADGIAQAISDNKACAKRSTTFCGVGRSAYIAMLNVIATGEEDTGTLEFFKHQDNALLILSAYADAYRNRLLDKNHLYEALGYMVRGFNAEAIVQHNKTEASPLLVVHCYSVKQNTPAIFTFDAKPAKQPKQKTASGKSDAPSASPIDRDTATTEQKVSLIADLPNPYTEQAIITALGNGSLSMATLKRAVGRYEMDKASKIITKSANRAQSAIDKELQALMATC